MECAVKSVSGLDLTRHSVPGCGRAKASEALSVSPQSRDNNGDNEWGNQRGRGGGSSRTYKTTDEQ
eukprot:355724-Hanusia_phi.AAC.1